jgi:hypothetical protein
MLLCCQVSLFLCVVLGLYFKLMVAKPFCHILQKLRRQFQSILKQLTISFSNFRIHLFRVITFSHHMKAHVILWISSHPKTIICVEYAKSGFQSIRTDMFGICNLSLALKQANHFTFVNARLANTSIILVFLFRLTFNQLTVGHCEDSLFGAAHL